MDANWKFSTKKDWTINLGLFGGLNAFAEYGVGGFLLWLVFAALLGWLYSTMVGVILGVFVSAAAAASWFSWSLILRVFLGLLGGKYIGILWLFFVVASWFFGVHWLFR